KVRKAEVPPPSNFNRRVTPELDAISLKALARDVADRYQTASQLAADLDALIGSYRFDPKELRQFMRQLFRKEHAKEVEDAQLALDPQAVPGGLSMAMTSAPRAATSAVLPPVIAGTPPNPVPQIAIPAARSDDRARDRANDRANDRTNDRADRRRGFWGNLFKKRK
ncbi:MAG: hypothetical protein ABIY55_23365, partial [Kofleriaceae bacterium]